MSENDTLELKRLMVKHYAGLLEEEIKSVVNQKGYSQKYFDNMLNGN